MVKATSLRLDEHSIHFIERQIHEGRYGDADEVMRAGLRLLEEREAQLDALRMALEEGEASGISEDGVKDVWRAVRNRL
ncbi:type II toxin-antitoxin system ParD family antitoxin [Acidisoma sp. 7E03]